MTEAEIKLYRFLVKMGRITKEEFKDITGIEYDAIGYDYELFNKTII